MNCFLYLLQFAKPHEMDNTSFDKECAAYAIFGIQNSASGIEEEL